MITEDVLCQSPGLVEADRFWRLNWDSDTFSAPSTSECLLNLNLPIAPSFLTVTSIGARSLKICRSFRRDDSAFRISSPTLGLVEAKRFLSGDPSVRPLFSVSEYLLFLLGLAVTSFLGVDESYVFPDVEGLPLAGGTSFEGSGLALEFR